jgi:tRNA dimethylallyltransferase
MEARSVEAPLVVIVGPTASGKTSLAVELAERYDGEIICADSRTVYREMSIGTAKPTLDEQRRVPHWGLDLVEPGERFTAADFKLYAFQKINEIRDRGHIPFLVGGTGLYVDGVVFDYQFNSSFDELLREKLELFSVVELQDYCIKINIDLPENRQNKRYLIRAIERQSNGQQRDVQLLANTIIVGIATDRDTLRDRIRERSEHLFENGVVEEATKLGKKYGWNNEAMTGNIYPLVHLYLESKISLDEMKDKFTTLDWRLAKRQLTWLRRNPAVNWLSLEDARQYLLKYLANEHKS